MSLLDTIKSDALKARKSRNTIEASLLTTLASEAAMVGKNSGNRESTDDEVRAVVKRFLKNNTETLAAVTDPLVRTTYETEREILSRYIERELSEEEIRTELVAFGEVTVRDMGRVMAHLNQKYPGRVPGKLVSQIVKG